MTPRKKLLLAGVALIALAIAIVALLAVRVPRAVARRAFGKTERAVDVAALVTQIRGLSRLETASMRVTHISTISQSYGAVPDQLLGDKLTFLAVGDVIAGVDLALIKEQDIRRTADGALVVDLPPPMILVVRVDNQESRVINRSTGMLRRTDVHMETRARARAEAGIRNEAFRSGILRIAEQEAEKRLADFLHKVGFQRVIFEHREAPVLPLPDQAR